MMLIPVPSRATSPNGTEAAVQPGFVDLIERIEQRIGALGFRAEREEISAAALEIAQDVARFSLSWVEGEPDADGSE